MSGEMSSWPSGLDKPISEVAYQSRKGRVFQMARTWT